MSRGTTTSAEWASNRVRTPRPTSRASTARGTTLPEEMALPTHLSLTLYVIEFYQPGKIQYCELDSHKDNTYNRGAFLME